METRLNQLSQLHTFVEGVDKDLTMILQNLQWDRKRLLVDLPMGICRYNDNHKLSLDKMESHEKKCFMKLQHYSEDDEFLPDPLDMNANTLVKLSTQQIFRILNDASRCNPLFKRGNKWESRYLEPWTLERLQTTYTADERCAIHDAVVQAVPSCHDLADLALPSCNNDEEASKVKSRVEILAELRDMKRRRPKYRIAAKTRNYSDVLRDVIKTQMEFYSESSQFTERSKTASKCPVNQDNNNSMKSEKRWNRNDYSTPSCSTRDRDQQIILAKKEVKGNRPNEGTRDRQTQSKYYKSPTRETIRYNSSSNTANNSNITRSESHSRDRHKPNNNHRSSSREKVWDRDNFKHNNSIRVKTYESESRERHKLLRRTESGEYYSSDRSKRKIKERPTQGSYGRKRNIESYTSDDSQDYRTSGNDSRDKRKNRRRKRSREAEEGQSQSYNRCNSVNRCGVERTHIKSERLETPERDAKPGRTQTQPGYTNNRNSESRTCIKHERINSFAIELEKQGNYSNTCMNPCTIRNTNISSTTFIKVEKSETTDRQYSHSRTESDSSGNTKDENRESKVRIRKEKVDNTDKRTRDREKQSGYYNTSTYTDRHVKNAGRSIVYLERSSERQPGHRDSTNSNRGNNVSIKKENAIESNSRNNRTQSPNDDKYNTVKNMNRERGDPSRRYDKSNSYHDKEHAKSDVTDTHASSDERRKRKKYS